jgi:hypothetical protein
MSDFAITLLLKSADNEQKASKNRQLSTSTTPPVRFSHLPDNVYGSSTKHKTSSTARTCRARQYHVGEQLRWEVQHWLFPPDPSTNQSFVRKARHKGTAAWFFESSALTEWRSRGSLLWIHGTRTFFGSVDDYFALRFRDSDGPGPGTHEPIQPPHTRSLVFSLQLTPKPSTRVRVGISAYLRQFKSCVPILGHTITIGPLPLPSNSAWSIPFQSFASHPVSGPWPPY